MMSPKKEAEQLVNNFSPFVYCYMGSGMLTNTSDDEVIKMNAKMCALKVFDEILYEFDHLAWDNDTYGTSKMKYWQQVKQEIEKL